MTATLQRHANGHYTWSQCDAESKVELFSTAFLYGDQVVLIDPCETSPQVESELTKLGRLSIIFLTSGNHERTSSLLRKKWGIPVAASANAVPEISQKPDIILEEDQTIHDLTPIDLSGGAAGETAFFHPRSKTIILGDAVIHLPKYPLMILPEKYCTNPAGLKNSLQKLLQLDFEHLMFAHGNPILSTGKKQLAQLLQTP